MLKEVVRVFFTSFGYFLSFVFMPKLIDYCNYAKDSFYSGTCKRRFKSFDGRIKDGFIKVTGGKYITISAGVIIYKGTRIEVFKDPHFYIENPCLQIGENTRINCFSQINCINSITIGKNCGFGANVYISDSVHGDFRTTKFTFNTNPDIPDVFLQSVLERTPFTKPIVIEDNVHIGNNAIILPGVTIGHNSIISSNTIVNKNVAPYSIVSSLPGKVILKCLD